MKQIIFIFSLLFFLASCKDNNITEPTIIYKTETKTVYVHITNYITNTVDIPAGPVDFFIYEDETIYVYRDNQVEFWTNTHAAYAGNFQIAISNVLYCLDNNGNITNSIWLSTVPDKIAINNNSDIYITKNIPPQDALDLGAMYRDYTVFWKNNSTIGDAWNFNEYKIINLFLSKDNTMIYQKDNFTFNDFENTKFNFMYATEDILIYDYTGGLSAKFLFNDHNFNLSWLQNYLPSSWTFKICNNNLYTVNGYRISPDGIMHNFDNILTNFTTPIAAIPQIGVHLCTRIENSEEVMYLLNCNYGDVYRYIPSLDSISKTGSLYNGNGDVSIAGMIARKINPRFINDKIFYKYNDELYEYNFIYSMPIAGDCEIWD